MLIIILLVHVQVCWLSGQTQKEVLTSKPYQDRTYFYYTGEFANNAVQDAVSLISSSHMSVRFALHHCVLKQHLGLYQAYIRGALLCSEEYYQFCILGNDVVHAQKSTSKYATECMRVILSEPTPSQNARIWDIRVPAGFHVNLTVIDLQMTYHPHTHCHPNLVKDERYTGQGLAIGNYTAVCQSTKCHSYLIPVRKVRIILNYT